MYVKEGALSQFRNSVLKPFYGDFGPVETQLMALYKVVRDEALLAAQQGQRDEESQALAFRARRLSRPKRHKTLQYCAKNGSIRTKLGFLPYAPSSTIRLPGNEHEKPALVHDLRKSLQSISGRSMDSRASCGARESWGLKKPFPSRTWYSIWSLSVQSHQRPTFSAWVMMSNPYRHGLSSAAS
jgi:hypothetical protein